MKNFSIFINIGVSKMENKFYSESDDIMQSFTEYSDLRYFVSCGVITWLLPKKADLLDIDCPEFNKELCLIINDITSESTKLIEMANKCDKYLTHKHLLQLIDLTLEIIFPTDQSPPDGGNRVNNINTSYIEDYISKKEKVSTFFDEIKKNIYNMNEKKEENNDDIRPYGFKLILQGSFCYGKSTNFSSIYDGATGSAKTIDGCSIGKAFLVESLRRFLDECISAAICSSRTNQRGKYNVQYYDDHDMGQNIDAVFSRIRRCIHEIEKALLELECNRFIEVCYRYWETIDLSHRKVQETMNYVAKLAYQAKLLNYERVHLDHSRFADENIGIIKDDWWYWDDEYDGHDCIKLSYDNDIDENIVDRLQNHLDVKPDEQNWIAPFLNTVPASEIISQIPSKISTWKIGTLAIGISHIVSLGASRIFISGGTILSNIVSNDNSTINVSGGLIDENPPQGTFVKANNNSNIRVSGAVFTYRSLGYPNRIVSQAEHDGVVTFVGECFSIGGQNVNGRLDLESLAASGKAVRTVSEDSVLNSGVVNGFLIEHDFQITRNVLTNDSANFYFIPSNSSCPNEGEVPENGLVAYWSMNDGSGGFTGLDNFSNNDGELIDQDSISSWTPDGLLLEGGYVEVPTDDYGLTNAISVIAWVRINSDDPEWIISKYDGADYGWMLTRHYGSNSFEWKISTNGNDWNGGKLSSTSSFPINQRIHVASTSDGNQMRILINNNKRNERNLPDILKEIKCLPMEKMEDNCKLEYSL